MSDRVNKSKPAYQAPTLLPLGEMAKATGACGTGSLYTAQGGCGNGSIPGNKACTSGGGPKAGTCVSGTTN